MKKNVATQYRNDMIAVVATAFVFLGALFFMANPVHAEQPNVTHQVGVASLTPDGVRTCDGTNLAPNEACPEVLTKTCAYGMSGFGFAVNAQMEVPVDQDCPEFQADKEHLLCQTPDGKADHDCLQRASAQQLVMLKEQGILVDEDTVVAPFWMEVVTFVLAALLFLSIAVIVIVVIQRRKEERS